MWGRNSPGVHVSSTEIGQGSLNYGYFSVILTVCSISRSIAQFGMTPRLGTLYPQKAYSRGNFV
jgi:hypothetical protein